MLVTGLTWYRRELTGLTADEKTRAIVIYVEGMSDGRSFLQQAYRTTLAKPVVVLQGGRSAKGSRSVGSHTGALAGVSEVARTAFERAGIITVDHSDELFPAAEALSSLPPIRNPRIAILADGGGHATIAAELHSPVALKICSPDILHKSDAGGVRLGLVDADAVRAAFAEIVANASAFRPQSDIRGCVVSPMSAPGTEVIIGTKLDPQFGPVIMFGIGGILVEVLRDVVFRVLPISRRAARSMLSELRSSPILNGVRGQPSVARAALVDLLLTVSEVVEAYPRIREMDLNPVIAREHDLSVVDARIILNSKS